MTYNVASCVFGVEEYIIVSSAQAKILERDLAGTSETWCGTTYQTSCGEIKEAPMTTCTTECGFVGTHKNDVCLVMPIDGMLNCITSILTGCF